MPVTDSGGLIRGALRYRAPISVGNGLMANGSSVARFTLRAVATWACCELSGLSPEVKGQYEVVRRTPPPALPDLQPGRGSAHILLAFNVSSGTMLFFQLDDSSPLDPQNGLGMRYTEPLVLGVGRTTVRARAWAPPLSPSEEVRRTYDVAPRAAPPALVPTSGCRLSPVGVSCIAPGQLALRPPGGLAAYYVLCPVPNATFAAEDARRPPGSAPCRPFAAAAAGVDTVLYNEPLQFAAPQLWVLRAAAADANQGTLAVSEVRAAVIEVQARAPAVAFAPLSGSVVQTGGVIRLSPVGDPPLPQGLTVWHRAPGAATETAHRDAPQLYNDSVGIPIGATLAGLNVTLLAFSRKEGWIDGPWAAGWFVVDPPPALIRALIAAPFDRSLFATRLARVVGCCGERLRVTGARRDPRRPQFIAVDFNFASRGRAEEMPSAQIAERIATADPRELRDRLAVRSVWYAGDGRPPEANGESDLWTDDDDWFSTEGVPWWLWVVLAIAGVLLLLLILVIAVLASSKRTNREADEPLEQPLTQHAQQQQREMPAGSPRAGDAAVDSMFQASGHQPEAAFGSPGPKQPTQPAPLLAWRDTPRNQPVQPALRLSPSAPRASFDWAYGGAPSPGQPGWQPAPLPTSPPPPLAAAAPIALPPRPAQLAPPRRRSAPAVPHVGLPAPSSRSPPARSLRSDRPPTPPVPVSPARPPPSAVTMPSPHGGAEIDGVRLDDI